jgi:hypothetical protein
MSSTGLRARVSMVTRPGLLCSRALRYHPRRLCFRLCAAPPSGVCLCWVGHRVSRRRRPPPSCPYFSPHHHHSPPLVPIVRPARCAVISQASAMSSIASSSQPPVPGGLGGEGGDEKNRCVRAALVLRRRTMRVLMRSCTCCSVVIKVGMVGDSQIGKTSLMVKYVEGSFDEDYIQTLGESIADLLASAGSNRKCRGELHGEDNYGSTDDDYVLHLGSGRPARVREHAAACVQRRSGYPVHVRPLT